MSDEKTNLENKRLSPDRWVTLLYILLRDEVQPGVIERLVTDIEKIEGDAVFCNGYLADYAVHLAERLDNSSGMIGWVSSSIFELLESARAKQTCEVRILVYSDGCGEISIPSRDIMSEFLSELELYKKLSYLCTNFATKEGLEAVWKSEE